MTDKEKIVEMAKVLHDRIVDKTWRAEKVAEEIYKIAVPEGSVVLTGKETDEQLEDLLIEFDEMGFYPSTTVPNPDEYSRDYKKRLIYAIGQLRKETAREILNAMLDIKPDFSLLDDCTPSEFLRSVDLATNIIFQAVKEQAKCYGVEVEE